MTFLFRSFASFSLPFFCALVTFNHKKSQNHKDLDSKGEAGNVLEVKDCSSPLDHSLDLRVSFLEQFFRVVEATFAVSV